MSHWIKYLEGGDLRSIANADKLVSLIKTQSDFDILFKYLDSKERLLEMRTADVVEKISMEQPILLAKHKRKIIRFLKTAIDKEFKWHLSLMVGRLDLSANELDEVWEILSRWAREPGESRIVRVNSIQSLFDLSKVHKEYQISFQSIAKQIREENIPSITARLNQLKKKRIN